jgi:integrase
VKGQRGALTEEEVLSLFSPKVLLDTMEFAVCAAMFLAGLRRGELFALRPEDLDWRTPKITVRHAWQLFNLKTRRIGPIKGKKERVAPFEPVLQGAIKKLWEENGRHEFVFSYADGKTPGPSWIIGRFAKWLERAGIDPEGRKLAPHSSRHSLATLLEGRGLSLRYIQDLLGHSDHKTTAGYLHTTDETIWKIGEQIERFIKPEEEIPEDPDYVIRFPGA